MATYKYTYSRAADFGDSIVSSQFQSEVNADGGVTPNLTNVERIGDVICLWFDAALSGGEVTTLAGLIAAHTSDASEVFEKTQSVIPVREDFSNSNYERIGTYIYDGSASGLTIRKILAVAHLDSGVTSYSIRIFDFTNNNTVAEATGSSVNEAIIDLGTISNVPAGRSIFEIQVKKTGGGGNKFCHLHNVTFYL